ncbi:hypothetical protein TrST_g5171 [Triparma strigata]|uniref:Uncharacterized protein n=1 Tax=Triparma strigata TaxID=1606541 RepID=A0A9W6ZQ10_9STRA|nr:hypothetical protein TrST_g5171 [Triparma strigata]
MVFLEDGRLPDFYDVVPPSMVLFLLVICLLGGFLNGFSLSYVWTYYLITWYFHSFLTDPIGRWWRIGRGEKHGGRGFKDVSEWYEYYAPAKNLEDIEKDKQKERDILERRLREERRIENMTGERVRNPVIVRTRQGQIVPPLPASATGDDGNNQGNN